MSPLKVHHSRLLLATSNSAAHCALSLLYRVVDGVSFELDAILSMLLLEVSHLTDMMFSMQNTMVGVLLNRMFGCMAEPSITAQAPTVDHARSTVPAPAPFSSDTYPRRLVVAFGPIEYKCKRSRDLPCVPDGQQLPDRIHRR